MLPRIALVVCLLCPIAPVLAATATGAQALPAAEAAEHDRPVIAVLKFQDESGAMFLQGGAGRALTTMLTNELSARPAFNVVERRKLRAVLDEQNLSASGRVSAETSIEIGKLTGAQYLLTGTVTAFEDQIETKVRRGFLGVGAGVQQVSHGGYLAVDLRVIDTTTGEIRYARTVEGRTPPGDTKDLSAGAMSIGSLDDGPGSRALRAAVIEIIDYLDCAMTRRDTCLAEYDAKERTRIERTKQSVEIRR
jgi:curli biogenesis system outer membrane secretion channel CsgG